MAAAKISLLTYNVLNFRRLVNGKSNSESTQEAHLPQRDRATL